MKESSMRFSATVAASTVAICFGIFGTFCQEDMRRGKKSSICQAVATAAIFENEWLDELETTIFFLLVPTLVASVLVYVTDLLDLFSATQPKECSAPPKRHQATIYSLWSRLWNSWVKGGNANLKLWGFFTVLLPACFICLDGVIYFGRQKELQEWAKKWPEKLSGAALTSGYSAVTALCFFMIPVAKQSPLLASLGWSPIQALSLHIWAGRVCFACTIIHTLLYCVIYGEYGKREGNKFFDSVVAALIPPQHCFHWAGITSFKEKAEINDGCYGYLRNFVGLLSTIFLSLLMLTSLNSIRQWNYRLFYISHVVTGSAMLIFAIMHIRFIVLYILPSILYYVCTTSPIVIQMLANFFLDKGRKLEEFTIIGGPFGECAEIVFPKTVACAIVENKQAAPYVRICVPEISLLWHPFTVATTPHDKDSKLKILFRRYGYFTTTLINRLKEQKRPLPIILVDGYYFGPDWVTAALHHDEVLIVAGGIGITPFLSMIRMLHDKIISLGHSEDSIRLEKISLHWFCRDEGLIRHVIKDHFSYFVVANPQLSGKCNLDEVICSIKILIHFTGREVTDLTTFSLEEPGSTQEECIGPIPESSKDGKLLRGTTDTVSFPTTQNVADETLSKHHQQLFPVQNTHISIEKNTKKKYLDGEGIPVECARFSLGVQSSWSILCFSFCFIGGLIIHKYYYKNFIIIYKFAIAFRAYSTYAVVVWSLLVGVLYEVCHRCYFHRKFSHYQLPQQEEIHLPDDRIATMREKQQKEGSCFEELALPFVAEVNQSITGKKLSIHIDVHNGRPLLDDIVEGVTKNAHLPGAFFCGPSKLSMDVQNFIKRRRREYKGKFCTKCCIYKEDWS